MNEKTSRIILFTICGTALICAIVGMALGIQAWNATKYTDIYRPSAEYQEYLNHETMVDDLVFQIKVGMDLDAVYSVLDGKGEVLITKEAFLENKANYRHSINDGMGGEVEVYSIKLWKDALTDKAISVQLSVSNMKVLGKGIQTW